MWFTQVPQKIASCVSEDDVFHSHCLQYSVSTCSWSVGWLTTTNEHTPSPRCMIDQQGSICYHQTDIWLGSDVIFKHRLKWHVWPIRLRTESDVCLGITNRTLLNGHTPRTRCMFICYCQPFNRSSTSRCSVYTYMIDRHIGRCINGVLDLLDCWQ
jgi:hypothetical protein